jgi:hypothetical protein
MRRALRMTGVLAFAITGGVRTEARADADATASRVLVVGSPSNCGTSVDAEQMSRALVTYLQDVSPAFMEEELAPEDAERRKQAEALAAERGIPFAAWWDCLERARQVSIVVSAVEVGAAGAPVTLTINDTRPVHAGLYREVALKLRAVLRAVMLTAERAETSAPVAGHLAAPVGPPAAQEVASTTSSQPARAIHPALEVFAATGVARSTQGGLPSLGGTASLEVGRLAFGLGLAQSLEVVTRSETGSAATRAIRIALQAEYGFAELRTPQRFFIRGDVSAGVDVVRSRTSLAEGDPDERQVELIVPFAGPGLVLGLGLGEHWELFGGVRVVVFPRSTRILIRGSQVYASGWVEPDLRLGVRLRI